MANLGQGLLAASWIVLALSVSFWAVAIFRLASGESFVEFQPRRAVPWGMIHLVMTLCLWTLTPLAAMTILNRIKHIPIGESLDALPPEQRVLAITALSLASIVAVILSLVFIRWSAGANAHDFGVAPSKWTQDIWLGAVGFVMLSVPVFCIQYALTQWVETKHPLVTLVQERPEPVYFALTATAAVIVAPLVEEFLFRVLLQGWLESVANALKLRASGLLQEDVALVVLVGVARTRSDAPMHGPAESPHSAPSGDPVDANDQRAQISCHAATPLLAPSVWPIFVSAAIFSLFHLGHGPDPIPLFVLAVGIGYMYQRTHRVLPCIGVHFLVNGFSMLQLWMATK